MIDIEGWARRKGQNAPNKGSWLNAVAIGYQVDLSVYKTNVLQGIAEKLGVNTRTSSDLLQSIALVENLTPVNGSWLKALSLG
jgi:nitric oxide synthase oxygenase domain/subunit